MTCSGTCLNPKCDTKTTYILTCETILSFFGVSPQACAPIVYTITYGIPASAAASAAYFGFQPNTNKTSSASPIEYQYEIVNNNLEPDLARSFITIESSKKMVGDPGLNNSMTANEDTKHIWSKNIGIIDLEKATGEVQLYYSLCSTKITDGKVGVIKNFNKEAHKINFFCSKSSPSTEEMLIVSKNSDNQGYTCIEVRESTVVCLVGKVDININDIGITNKTYIDSVFVDDII
jgi:hypothetical protein